MIMRFYKLRKPTELILIRNLKKKIPQGLFKNQLIFLKLKGKKKSVIKVRIYF